MNSGCRVALLPGGAWGEVSLDDAAEHLLAEDVGVDEVALQHVGRPAQVPLVVVPCGAHVDEFDLLLGGHRLHPIEVLLGVLAGGRFGELRVDDVLALAEVVGGDGAGHDGDLGGAVRADLADDLAVAVGQVAAADAGDDEEVESG